MRFAMFPAHSEISALRVLVITLCYGFELVYLIDVRE